MFFTNASTLYKTTETQWVIQQTPVIVPRPNAQRIIFLDRDGPCLIEPPTDGQIDSLNRFELTPGLIVNLFEILKSAEYKLVLVSNQDGVGTANFPAANFWQVQTFFLEILASQGIMFDEIFIDKSLPQDNQPTRKPGIAMLTKYLGAKYDLPNSWVIGDRTTDMKLAENLGCRGILFNTQKPQDFTTKTSLEPTLISNDWQTISQTLIAYE